MSEDPQKIEPRASRSRVRTSDLARETTESDLWDLDQDFPSPGTIPSAPDTSTGEPTLPFAEQPAFEPMPAPATASDASVPPTPKAPPETQPLESKPNGAPPKVSTTPLSPVERSGIIALALSFIGLAIWGISALSADLSTSSASDLKLHLPAAGQHATVSAIDTFWRTPIADGENRDPVRLGVRFIPVIEVTLAEGSSGVIRVLFRNRDGLVMGDSITRAFKNGTFTSSGTATAEFPATDGFEQDAQINAYQVGSNPWTFQVLEGPSADASGSDFKPLLEGPISPNRR